MDSKAGPSKSAPVPRVGQSALSNSKTSDAPEYLQHDSDQFKYYTCAIQQGFQKDCEKFLSEFAQFKSTSFTVFTDHWVNSGLRSVFMGDVKFVNNELHHMANTLFFTIRKYIKYSENIYVKVGAFYMLHAIYAAQGNKHVKVPIRLTHPEVKNILGMIEKLKKECIDIKVIFEKLRREGAFAFVATEAHFGLDPRYIWQDTHLEDDISKATKRPKRTVEHLKTCNYDRLIASYKAYDEALRKYEEKIGETIRVPRPEGNVAEIIAAQMKAIEKEFIRIQELDSD